MHSYPQPHPIRVSELRLLLIATDNSYDFGEWTADFTAGSTNVSEQVKITGHDASGASTTTVEGKIECGAKCETGTTLAGVPFKITTTGGDILRGICGYTNQVQAETSGLMIALSNKGIATPPSDFDSAMNTTNATVYTYYGCSKYKATCEFKLP